MFIMCSHFFFHLVLPDTIRERNILMEKAYPKLKEFCRERYGLEFQVNKYVELCSRRCDLFLAAEVFSIYILSTWTTYPVCRFGVGFLFFSHSCLWKWHREFSRCSLSVLSKESTHNRGQLVPGKPKYHLHTLKPLSPPFTEPHLDPDLGELQKHVPMLLISRMSRFYNSMIWTYGHEDCVTFHRYSSCLSYLLAFLFAISSSTDEGPIGCVANEQLSTLH